jgi:hypothetical protein
VHWIKGTLLLTCLLIGYADLVTTNVILSHGLGELNPVMRFAQEWLGSWWFIPKLGLTFVVMWLLGQSNNYRQIALIVACVSTATVNNIFVIVTLQSAPP